jgi:hypothetical protein
MAEDLVCLQADAWIAVVENVSAAENKKTNNTNVPCLVYHFK